MGCKNALTKMIINMGTWAARMALPKWSIVKDSLNVIGICLITHFFITLLLLGHTGGTNT